MKPIPIDIIRSLNMESAFCARWDEGTCHGRLTIEHAFGRERQKRWKLVILCWYHHLGSGLDKRMNKYLALMQATDDELLEEPKADYLQERENLKRIYGEKDNQRGSRSSWEAGR